MLIEQPVRGQGLPYWSNLHESLAACIESVLGPLRQPEEKKYLEKCVRDFLETEPGQWLAEAVHGEIPTVEGTQPEAEGGPG